MMVICLKCPMTYNTRDTIACPYCKAENKEYEDCP